MKASPKKKNQYISIYYISICLRFVNPFHTVSAMSNSWFIAVPLGFPSCTGLMLTTVKHVEVIKEPAALIPEISIDAKICSDLKRLP